jgi:hypothetical protein
MNILSMLIYVVALMSLAVASNVTLNCYVGVNNNTRAQLCIIDNKTSVCVNYIQPDGIIVYGCDDFDTCNNLKAAASFRNVTCCNASLCNNSSYVGYIPPPAILQTPTEQNIHTSSFGGNVFSWNVWLLFLIVIISIF